MILFHSPLQLESLSFTASILQECPRASELQNNVGGVQVACSSRFCTIPDPPIQESLVPEVNG